MSTIFSEISLASPQNLLKVDRAVAFDFLNSFDVVLSDCDGVIYVGYTALERSAEAIARLMNIGKKIHYVSNNCTLSTEAFMDKLHKCDINADLDDVVVPTIAIADYLKGISFNKKIFVIGLNTMREELRLAGFQIADSGPNYIEENLECFIAELRDDEDVGAVIVDIDVNMTYLRLQKALIYLQRSDVLFITACSDRKIPFKGSLTLLGPAYFQFALIDISGREPLAFGKPSGLLNEYVSRKYQLEPERTLFIGDSFSDMIFARDGGYQKMLVASGNTKKKEIEMYVNKSTMPEYYLEKLGDLCEILDDLNM